MLEPQHSRFSYDHLFLPPNLPAVDHDESGADALLKEIVQAANDFYRSYPQYSEERLIWDNLARSIQKWIDLYSEGTTCSFKIIETLKALGQNDVLMFYVKSQNAAIVLRNRSTGATFEAFEVLPQTEAVLRAHGALIRSFPARAVFVPKKTLNNVSFLEDLGTAIHKLSVEELRLATETTKKGADVVTEERQTVHSRMVTEWLIGGVLSIKFDVDSSQAKKRD